MATPINNVYHIPDGPYHPGQSLLSEQLQAAASTHEVIPGRPLAAEAQSKHPEYTPKVQLLVDISRQQAAEQKAALQKKRAEFATASPASKLAQRFIGHGHEAPMTLRQLIDLESSYHMDEILAPLVSDEQTNPQAAATSPRLTRSFFHDTRLYYPPEELDPREWRDTPNGAIEWVYMQTGPKPSDTLLYRYQVLPTEVVKIIEPYDERGMPLPTYWQTLQGNAFDNFLRAALRHYQMVSQGIYGNQPRHFDESIRKASETLLSQQVKTGQEVIRQTVTPESTNEKIRQNEEELMAYVDKALTDIHEEVELEAMTGESVIDPAPVELNLDDDMVSLIDLVERRAAQEYEKHHSGDSDRLAA